MMETEVKTPLSNGRKFDLMKLTLALMIVILHTSFYPFALMPLLRLAVPLFFILSSYFFFLKYEKLEQRPQKKAALKKYVFRNYALLIFWTIFALPLMYYKGTLYQIDLFTRIWHFLRALVFGDTFLGSWFISACAIAVPLVALASKKIPDKLLLFLTFIIYAYCSLNTNYDFFRDKAPSLYIAGDFMTKITGIPFTFTFVQALFWVAVGRMFARKPALPARGALLAVLLLAGISLFAEFSVIKDDLRYDDAYLSLVLLAPAIFALVLSSKDIKLENHLVLRKFSVILYCSHGVFKSLSSSLFNFFGLDPQFRPLFSFAFVLICASALAFIIFKLEDRIKFLKYAH